MNSNRGISPPGYQLLERIGGDEHIAVYRAQQLGVGRDVEVKVLALGYGGHDPRSAEQFNRELRLLAKLRHPNTVVLFARGQTDAGEPFFATEYVPGLGIGQLIATHGAVGVPSAIRLVRQVLGSLREAHALGIVHSNISPTSVMVFDRPDETEVVKVLDFGYARSVGEARRQDAARGTEGYMAPELAAGSAATPGADLFSVGLILYELVTRRSAVAGRTHPPFQAASVAGHAAIDRNNPHVPPELVEVLQRATAHHPQHRMRTAEEFLEALDAVERASRPPLSPPRPQVREDAPAAPRSSQPNVPVAAAAPGSDFFGDSTRAVTAEELEAANAGVQPGSSPGRPLSPSPVQAPLPAYGLGSEPEMTRALTAEELEMAGASAFQGAPTIPGDGPASPVRGAPAPSPWPASLDEGGDATVALDLDINDPWGVGTDGDNDDDDDDGDDRPAEGTMELDLNDIKIIASHALAGPDRTREVSLDEVLTFTGAKRTTTESD